MVQMMTKVLHVQQHKLHVNQHVNQQHKLHGVDDDMVLHVNQQHKLHGVDDDKGTSCKSTAQVAWCR